MLQSISTWNNITVHVNKHFLPTSAKISAIAFDIARDVLLVTVNNSADGEIVNVLATFPKNISNDDFVQLLKFSAETAAKYVNIEKRTKLRIDGTAYNSIIQQTFKALLIKELGNEFQIEKVKLAEIK